MIISGVPLISQMGEGANLRRTDCGPASQAMVLFVYKGVVYNPDDFYTFMEMDTDQGTYAKDLIEFAALFELEEVENKGVTLDQLRTFIDQQRPAICLINYKPISDAGLAQYPGEFNHWVVAVGYDDDHIMINDPYRTDGRSYLPVPNSVFRSAFYGTVVVPLASVTGEYVMTTTHRVKSSVTSLTVRSGPGTTFRAVGYLRTGEEVVVVSITDGWAQIDGPRLRGYSYASYLEPLPNVPTIKPDIYDVSHWETGVGSPFIDWKVIDLSGILAIITKATQGTSYINTTFGHDWGQLKYNLRVKRGTYHYFENNTDPIAQANHFIDTLQGDYGELVPALDCEDPEQSTNYANKIKTFLDHFESRTGIKLMIYTYPSWWNERVGNVSWAAAYKLWIAHYGVSQPSIPLPWTKAVIWQFSDSGIVSGIGGKVDMNKVYELPILSIPGTPSPGVDEAAIKKETINQIITALVSMRDSI